MYRVLPILKSPKRLIKVIVRVIRRVFSRGKVSLSDVPSASNVDSEFSWILPAKEKTERDYIKLIEREVKLCFVFTGGVHTYFRYPEQVVDGFQSINLAKITSVFFLPQADHVYSLVDHREEMIDRVTKWVLQEFNISC